MNPKSRLRIIVAAAYRKPRGSVWKCLESHRNGAAARDPWSAYEHIERLDHVCEIGLAGGVSPEAVADRAAAQRMHG